MSESRAAIRYAKATLDQAVENKALEAMEADMRSIVDTISESKELSDALSSPIVNSADKKNILLAVFKDTNAITKGLIGVLVDNKRISLLNEVALKYLIINEDLKGQGVAFVTTAVPLTADLEKKILDKVIELTGKKVVLKSTIDEKILGGFVLRVGDLQYDASIASKLGNLKREFTNSL
ncbi:MULTISPECIES: ATP synthase F1 subunit delta [Cellulophaga]|jgi:F-type H+-transporting ATPase subunit delta|uniref:ATP synthase subunit delta n=1 Tax=Cellulophaga baltica 18 TaxID=1348584 RepID=A0AAU8RTJ5_9FLAO|nr:MULTISPECIES: ATP synthase F1 subunit delta [Cellulophaga]AIZ41039.1 ATP synthase subunit delta [Cellulophaga baltica 18]KGK30447.1 ATP synthase subunit delta [Cellulophaga sp. E6(2014)]MBA6313793.1 ATP synthase F1 subunit delta [Cellulophaga baltica]MCR1023230.1 ATP synthase F1 subunit delta [Cellulophaga baltica]